MTKRIKADVQHFGWTGALRVWSLTAAKRLGKLTILQCVTLRSAKPENLKTNPRYSCSFLTREQLHHFAQADQAYELDPEFISSATAKGDRCFGIVDGEVLAAYGWYSTKPTAIDDRLMLHFDGRYVYMYKGFTHPNYRGQRLHAVGMGMALNAYLAEGSLGIVSYVEANNLSSLKSCYRLGYEDFGKISIWEAPGTPRIHNSSGCRAFGMKVTATEPVTAGIPDSKRVSA